MAYIVPSVLVYQRLLNAGGVLNATPDLHACPVGVCMNPIMFKPADPVALSLTRAGFYDVRGQTPITP